MSQTGSSLAQPYLFSFVFMIMMIV